MTSVVLISIKCDCVQSQKTMTSAGDVLENMSIDKWLAELHMECYKKNLEKFNTIKVSGSLQLRGDIHFYTLMSGKRVQITYGDGGLLCFTICKVSYWRRVTVRASRLWCER